MHLTHAEVRHVAELAKLALTDEEIATFATQLSAILDYADLLKQVDTSHVAPTPTMLQQEEGLPLESVLREDAPLPGLSNEQALANAPASANGFFQVRAVFGAGEGDDA